MGATLFKRALKLTPKDDDLKKSLSTLLANAAVTSLNKGNASKAMTLAKESLLHNPANGGARQVLDALKKPAAKPRAPTSSTTRPSG